MLDHLSSGRSALVESPDLEASPKWLPVFHPLLIAAFPILALYRQNVNQLPADVLVVPLALTLIATALGWVSLRFWTGETVRSGLLTSLLAVVFFGYEGLRNGVDDTWNYLKSFWVMSETHVYPAIFLAIVALMISAGAGVIFKWLRRPALWTSYLNFFALILVIMPTYGIVATKIAKTKYTNYEVTAPTLERQGWTPDIYFILLDGYDRSDVLEELYGLDNRPFLERLERRGFSVASRSTSCYCQTQLSLASTLNADYLDKLIDPRNRDLLTMGELIKNNLVKNSLRSRGYKYVTFQTGFDPTETSNSDIYLEQGPNPSVFNQFLIAMTPLAPLTAVILPQAKWHDHYSMTRDRVLYTLNKLPSIAKIPGPTFTFAHILSPHPPFVFGEHGEDVSPRLVSTSQNIIPKVNPIINTPGYVRNAYRQQVQFLTAQIDRTIDQILAESPEPPVILLQSDHGSWLRYHLNDAEATDVHERCSTLNAMLIPGRKPEGFSDDIGSVNTFRIVLNNVFGARMPLLPTRNYFSTLDNPLEFIDVTDRLHSETERNRKFEPPKSYIGLMQQF